MTEMNSAGEVFEEWAGDHRAPGMEKGHWPVVRQAFEPIPEMTGNYLEIGVGNGYSLHHMAANQFRGGHCYGIDLAPGMVDLTEERLRNLKNVTVEQADFLEWLPPPGVLFSLIFSMEVFYYFSDIQKGIEKAYSLLAPGGKLMVMVDYFLENDATLDWPRQLGAPMQLWSQRDYREGMKKAGFEQVEQQLYPNPGENGASTETTLCTIGLKP